jgi:hypothetical protein
MLSDIYSDIFSDILLGILSDILCDILHSQLRSRSAHWDPALAVEVRQWPLIWRSQQKQPLNQPETNPKQSFQPTLNKP